MAIVSSLCVVALACSTVSGVTRVAQRENICAVDTFSSVVERGRVTHTIFAGYQEVRGAGRAVGSITGCAVLVTRNAS